ncbi:hypothetical protein LCGC14_2958690 [marine sediment metagenome]|uniref:Uncharacterized protein n=1 Tax=marine sediment metagenome TaxID=412755 RepID=A0A0F8ZKN7_9ZZZZ
MTLDVGWVAPIIAASIVASVAMIACWASGLRNRGQERWENSE